MKRFFSLILSLVIIATLFVGITPPAQAADLIGDLLNNYFFKKGYMDELFNEENCVAKEIPCGAGTQDALVMYNIYEISGAALQASSIYQKMNAIEDFQVMLIDPNETYYTIKFFGNGEMKDYERAGSGIAPWTATTYTLPNGEVMHPDQQLIAAYVEGKNSNGKGGVRNVGNCAFFGLDSLYAVFLGDTVTRIGERAFESNESLSAINMPSVLETMGERAFYGCDKLTFWRAGNTKLTEISQRAFYGCSLLEAVQFPGNLKVIDEMAFAWCHVLGDESFNFPSSLTTIKTGAFMFDTHIGRVNELTIPSNVMTIGDLAFFCCFGLGKGENIGLNFSSGTTPLTIGKAAFAGCRELKTLQLPARLVRIKDGAFAACERLKNVLFSSDVNSGTATGPYIEQNAFTSLQGTAATAIDYVGAYMSSEDSLPLAGYDDDEKDAFYSLTEMTPLEDAAFQCLPAKDILAASSLERSFPENCIVHYPTKEYNATANTKWQGALDPGATTWKGYPTEGDWTGHFHAYEVTETKEATHTQDGFTRYTCSICKDSYTETIEKGHQFEEYNRVDPTCTEPGAVVYHCTREGCSYPNGFYYETLPALGHDESTIVTVKEATCTEDGLRQGYCSRCKQYINEIIPAKGHNMTLMTVVPATCSHDGYAYGFCIDCMKTIPEDDPIILPASGVEHQWDAGRIAAQPTCTDPGVRIFTCSVCGDTKTETIPATGHDWGEWVVVKEPTKNEPGLKQRVCKNDPSHIQTEEIPATGVCDGGASCPSRKFVDVDHSPDCWYHEPVDWAVENNITAGVNATHFDPNGKCTRSQAVTFLWRAKGMPEPTATTSPFSDVPEDSWYFKPVLWAVENNITAGVGGGRFDPEGTCTRSQIVTFLWRMAGQPAPQGTASGFSDVPAGEWFADPVAWAVENGITSGYPDGRFGPNDNCTRAQIVTFLWRKFG